MNLSTTIKSIQDIMRKDDGVDGDAQRIGQLTWMLFLKVFDQREQEWEDDAREQGKKYKSPLQREHRWRNWAAYVAGEDGKKKPQAAASDIISFVNNNLFPALKYLDASKGGLYKVIRSVFEDANNYMKSGTQLLAVIEKLEEAIHFDDFKQRAQLGAVYEQLLNDLRGAGNAGEFYTPRAITQFMVDRVDPRLDKREKVLDPACGTGGFLTAAIDHFRNQITTKSGADDKRAIEELIRGIEKKQLPHLLCTTNLLLHGIDVPSQIEHKNTLSIGWNEWHRDDRVQCIVTNPPFGGYEDDNVGTGYHHPTKETADLFMQLIVKLLEENGRAAVVLPDGFLFGDGIKAEIKRRLMQQCKLHTIVRLPKGVFAPYTTIKTNLLFFTKGAAVEDGAEHFHTETIWFYEHPYPPGYKSYSKTKPIRFEEFKPEQEWWGSEENNFADRVENEFAWKVEFKTKREQAEAAARPHWQRAELLRNQAADKRRQAKYLADSLVGRRKDDDLAQMLREQLRDLKADLKTAREFTSYTETLIGAIDAALKQASPPEIVSKIEAVCAQLRAEADAIDLQTRDAQAAGDRLYWPIFNLDLKNPNAPEEESHDPDVLLEKYKRLLGEIEETENQLKSELAAALAHHFTAEAGAE